MNNLLKLFMLGTFSALITFYGLPVYKREVRKYKINKIKQIIQLMVRLCYVDDRSAAPKQLKKQD